MTRPRLYAHRGAAAELPENTLPAFRRALALGADALEMDVHVTRDGVVVVSHDATGERMARVPRAIHTSTLAAVQAWDVGQGFVDARGERPFASEGYRIPTLEEVITELPDVPLNVDIKQTSPPAVETVVTLLRRLGAEERVTLASFHGRTLRAVRRLGYRGPTGMAQDEVIRLIALPRLVQRFLRPQGVAAQIPTHVGPLVLANRRVVHKLKSLGMRVDFWTINQPEEAARLLALGADGIMTDDPAAIAPVFGR